MITSRANERVKRVRRLLSDKRFRQQEGAFVVEGNRWLAELAAAEVRPDEIYCTADWLAAGEHATLLEQLGTPILVDADVLASMSDTETSPGVLAVVSYTPRPIPESAELLLILDGVANPGNLGTILRTAAAAGVGGVILSPGSVDPTNPKVVRGSMGALLRLPVRSMPWVEIIPLLARREVWLASAMASSAMPHTAVDWQKPAALIIGSEAQGAGAEAEAAATGRVTIPIADTTESLNAAVAAGVILFEAARQRSLVK